MPIFATWQECMVKSGGGYFLVGKIWDQSLVEIPGVPEVP